MINKIKNMTGKIMVLVLMLIMGMPTNVFAGTYEAKDWNEYKEKLKIAIINQEETIIINFNVGERFTSESLARVKIAQEYKDAKKNISKHLGELNIISETETTVPVLKGTLLESVTHTMNYNNTAKDFIDIRKILSEKYKSIKTKDTDYKKIKEAYDYILEELDYQNGYNNHGILSGLKENEKKAVSADAYAMLFSIMMDELGYENIIIVGTIKESKERHVWNLVKVQGNWYHVDSRLGDVGSDGDKYFLTSDEIMGNKDSYGHYWEIGSDYEVKDKYQIDKSLEYEIKIITKYIKESLDVFIDIANELDNIKLIEAEAEIKIISEKIMGYKNSINIISKLIDNENQLYKDLEKSLEDLISIEQEVLGKVAEVLVKIAENSKLRSDIDAAKEAVERLNDGEVKAGLINRITSIEEYISNTIEEVEKAEKILFDYELIDSKDDEKVNMAVNIIVNKAYNAAQEAKKSVATLPEDDTKEGLNSIIAEINNVKLAKDEIVKAEGTITKENIDAAKKATNLVNAKFNSIKENLSNRIAKLEQGLKDTEENGINKIAIDAVNTAEFSIKNAIYGDVLSNIISSAEGFVKIAEIEVKKIKDTGIRTAQQNRIKDIKLVITAIKAVNKAETVKPPSVTNVKSARTAISKLSEEYENVGQILNLRIEEIDDSIKFVDAEKLIGKAEISLKKADYDKAKVAVEKLDITKGKGLELNNRRQDVEEVILAKEAVENTEKLMKANKEKVEEYEAKVGIAEETYKIPNEKNNKKDPEDKDYQAKYGDIIKELGSRIGDMNTAIGAIELVEKVEDGYDEYLGNVAGAPEVEKLNSDINEAKTSIERINDKNTNLTNIKKSLLSRLKTISDRLNADGDYNKVSGILSKIEDELVEELSKKDKDLDLAINSYEVQILNIVELSKGIKISSQSKDLKDRTMAINDVIAAIKAVVIAEEKHEKTISKDITAASKAVEKLRTTGIYRNIKEIGDFKGELINRIDILAKEVEASTNESKAIILVEKAINSKKETDIKSAIEAVSKLVDGTQTKNTLSEDIEVKIVEQLIKDANTTISIVIRSIEQKDDKSVAKNVTEAKKAVLLVENIVLFANDKLKPMDYVDYKTKYDDKIKGLNEEIEVIDISVVALKAVQQAEKVKKQEDVDIANKAIVRISDKEKYKDMKGELSRRIKIIEDDLADEASTVKTAEDAVAVAEGKMGVDENPTSKDLRDAQDAVNKVSDKTKKAELQKRIDAMTLAIAAKTAVDRVDAYIDAAGVKAAEKALDKLVKTGLYFDIVKDLSMRIGNFNKELNISKLVADAANLVQKAVESRKQNDVTIARDAVDGIKEFVNLSDPNNPYDSLVARLVALVKSIEDEEKGETTALETAKDALAEALIEIDGVNTDIAKIIEGETEEADIKRAYTRIQVAKNHIIASNAAIRRLIDQKQQKDLLKEIDYANKEIELAEDSIDVKEAVRLVTIASTSVMKAKDENSKSQARLDIAAARRAIDRIGHNDNKAIKTTILNTINSIEKKLTTDNDQELIDLAVIAVNKAAETLTEAVRKGNVIEKQEQIDKEIFAARMAIGWISDNNKAAKITLTGFLDDIVAMFTAEKEGILNEDRIKNAEAAVKLAEENKGNDMLENYIRSARLRVKMINNDSPETAVIINDLNTRLDALEGKGGSGGSGSGTGSGGSNKPGNGGTTPGKVIPTTPLSDKDRVIGTTDPIWGKTNELNKKNPITNLSTKDITAYRIYESKMKIVELSNLLKTMQSTNAKLIVRGKNIALDSSIYIHDKVNNSILVPVKFLGDELGFSVSLIDSPITKGAKRLLLNGMVDGKPKSIIMDLGSEFCYVNGNLVKISSKPLINVGRTYIPLDLMVEHFGLTFSYYIQGNNLQLIIN